MQVNESEQNSLEENALVQNQQISEEGQEQSADDVNDSLEESNENVESQDNDDDDDENEDKEIEPHLKKHFRRLEKKIKKENKQLRQQVQQYEQFVQGVLNQPPMVPQQTQGEMPQVDPDEAKFEAWSQKKQQQYLMQQQQQQIAELQTNFNQALERGSDKYDDFDEVVRNPSIPITQSMLEASYFIDNPDDVLYSIAKDPAEALRIAQLTPYKQAQEVIKVSKKMQSGISNKVTKSPDIPEKNLKSAALQSPNKRNDEYVNIREMLKQKQNRRR